MEFIRELFMWIGVATAALSFFALFVWLLWILVNQAKVDAEVVTAVWDYYRNRDKFALWKREQDVKRKDRETEKV